MEYNIANIIRGKTKVALGGHIRPDGDCTGACVGLLLYIKRNFPNIQVDAYLEDIPKALYYINGVDQVKSVVDENIKYDLFISLDCGDIDRLGFALPLFNKAKITFCVDHHISNVGYADINFIIPTASSTCELVYQMIDSKLIDGDVAAALYMGITHDTGVFRFSNTSPESMEIAASLLRTGIRGHRIIEKTFYEKTHSQVRITGKALFDSQLLLDNKCIVSVIRSEDMEDFGVGTYELDGITSQLLLTEGIDVAIFICQLEKNEYKVSLRSSDKVDVSIIATHFGGGGHKKAAGFSTNAPSEEAIRLVCNEITKQL